jgi:hypothetical protein
MKREQIKPDELSCAAEIGITEVDETPCLVVRGPKKDGTIHYTIIPADLLAKHLHELFGPMDEFICGNKTQSNN